MEVGKGRKPKPRKFKILEGTRKDRINFDEPEFPPCSPKCPEYLDDGAKEEWDRLVPELENAGLTAEVYHAGLEAYCVSYSLWKEAVEKVFEAGTVVKAPKSGHPMQNPYLSIANKQFSNMHKIMAEFGLTPSSKTKIVVGNRTCNKPKLASLID